MTVEWPTPDHLYWPLLDVLLSVASIRNPGAFPLMSQRAGKGPFRAYKSPRVLSLGSRRRELHRPRDSQVTRVAAE